MIRCVKFPLRDYVPVPGVVFCPCVDVPVVVLRCVECPLVALLGECGSSLSIVLLVLCVSFPVVVLRCVQFPVGVLLHRVLLVVAVVVDQV